jgi:predicted DNA-binding transcriptional regulator YafY
MPRGQNQKLKLFYLAKIMTQETDAEHFLTKQQIFDELAEYGVTVERKTLYEDLKTLETFGIVISAEHDGHDTIYHVTEKKFEIAEIKLLIDAVQASKFITEKKSNDLIRKLAGFASSYEADQLSKQVVVTGRIKTMNESIYANVDAIQIAIAKKCKIKFIYLDWNLHGELVPRKKEKYFISPYVLMWSNENYYLVGYDSEDEIIKHYRVDKMSRISVTKDKRDGAKLFKKFDAAKYANENFGMFAGKEEMVTLEFKNDKVGMVIDRFGKDIPITPVNKSTSKTIVPVAVSGQFFGWVFGTGGDVKIEGPKEVIEEYKDLIKEMR